jgi:hypothetical protein
MVVKKMAAALRAVLPVAHLCLAEVPDEFGSLW